MSDEQELAPAHTDQRTRAAADEPITALGRWYRVKDDERTLLGCVTRLGSNYAKLTFVGDSAMRVHFDRFDELCEPVDDIDPILAQHVEQHRAAAATLMDEVRAIVAKLGLTGTTALTPDTQGLVLATSKQPIADYKAALVLAKKDTLPALFRAIEEENKAMAMWMNGSLIPLRATLEQARKSVDGIEDRSFNVELYAGLTEQVEQIADGVPAARDEKIRLMQRRCYMDEECLADYKAGGMDINGLEGFDKWLARSKNRNRILPFPRCVVAFRVRRNMKDRPWRTLAQLFSNMELERADKLTFLYIRNGDRLYRLSTEVDFEEKLFPDLDRDTYAGKLWVDTSWSSAREIISDREYRGLREDDKRVRAEIRKAPKKDRWRFRGCDGHRADDFTPVDPSNVYFDDANAKINSELKKHNRIALILQGLLDRSPVLHPHPAWRLWTDEDFRAALELIYDDSRTLTPGDAPDFEAYRTAANATLRVGSMTVGQRDFWRAREAKKGDHHLHSYKHYNDPGPPELERIAAWSTRTRTAVFRWHRQRVTARRYSWEPATYQQSVKVPAAALFNVEAYKPGDIKRFFADPRTRADYLRWAPLLITCEDWHAEQGKHK